VVRAGSVALLSLFFALPARAQQTQEGPAARSLSTALPEGHAIVPISVTTRRVGEIDIDADTPAAFGEQDRVFLERVAVLISAHCLVAWDTGGVAWQDVS